MNRSEIRYALFRCLKGTADAKHTAVLNTYTQQLNEYGFDISDFTKEWDVSKNDTSEIVTGKLVKKYNQDVSLFDASGKIKE